MAYKLGNLGADLLEIEIELMEVASQAAEEAGRRLLALFGTGKLSVRRKYDYPGSIVTNADEESEGLILARIKRSRFRGMVKSEESGTHDFGSHNITWAVDPLDGTLNFAKRIPYFSVSIGVLVGGRTVAGAIYNPLLDEMFTAARMQGAYKNGKRIHVSNTTALRNASLIYEWWTPEPSIPDPLGFEKKLYHFTHSIRSPGSVALNLCSVAAGKFDGIVTVFRRSPIYETAAGCLIVQEASGKVTDSDGGTWENFSRSILAGGAGIHRRLLSLVQAN